MVSTLRFSLSLFLPLSLFPAHVGVFLLLDGIITLSQATFLVISHATHKEHTDEHRYEKISNIVKQFKLGCQKTSGFGSMEVQNQRFTALIELFTPNTYVFTTQTTPISITLGNHLLKLINCFE